MRSFPLLFLLALFPIVAFAVNGIDINTAFLQQLEEITGVGPAIGQRIIDARPFSSVDDLLRVSGIGPKTLQKIKEQGLACVDCATQKEIHPVIRQGAPSNNGASSGEVGSLAAVSGAEVLQNEEKFDISNKVEGSPWFLFFTTLIATLALAGVVLFIKLKFLKENVRT